jgi:hypothetical protein
VVCGARASSSLCAALRPPLLPLCGGAQLQRPAFSRPLPLPASRGTLFRFDALAFRQLSASFLFSFTARCGFNLRFVLRFGIAAGLFCRFLLNALFVLTLSLFRQAALLFAVTVKSLFISRAISWSASNLQPAPDRT